MTRRPSRPPSRCSTTASTTPGTTKRRLLRDGRRLRAGLRQEQGRWTRAEGMNALLIMSMRFPDDPRQYRTFFDRQWACVRKNVMDAEHGEWYPTALDAGGNPKAAK